MRLIFLFLIAEALIAQQAIRVANAASHGLGSAPDGTIAPGSLVSIELNLQGGPFTPVDPGTVSIQLQPGGSVQVLGASGPLGILGLVSDDAPLGPAAVTMTFNGQTSAPAAVTIAPVNVGLFTRNAGIGPVMAQNSLTHPAQPGEFVTLWGTGLPQTDVQPLPVTVLFGGHAVVPSYAGPAPGLPGTDQINFQIPDDPAIPNGCYVAVAVKAGDDTSNVGMLSTSPDGGPCTSPFGFTRDQLAQLDAGQSVDFGQVNLYDMVGPPLSPSPWFNSSGFTRMESANAILLTVNAITVAQFAQPLMAEDTAYGCTSSRGSVGAFLSVSQELSAGDKVTLSTVGSSLDLLPQSPQFSSFYTAQLPQPPMVDSPDAVAPPFFASGMWQISAPGGKNVQSFTGQFNVPSPVRITNAGELASVDHTQDLTVTWNGTDYSNDYLASIQLNAPGSGVVCSAPASAGQVTIPAALIQSAPQALLELLLVPRSDRLAITTAPLGDGGTMPVVLRYYPSEVIPTGIR